MPSEDLSVINVTFMILILTMVGWATSVIYRAWRLVSLLWQLKQNPESVVLCPRRFVTSGEYTLAQLLDKGERKELLPRTVEVLRLSALVHAGHADARFTRIARFMGNRTGGGDGQQPQATTTSQQALTTVSLRMRFLKDAGIAGQGGAKLRFRVMWCKTAAEIERRAVEFVSELCRIPPDASSSSSPSATPAAPKSRKTFGSPTKAHKKSESSRSNDFTDLASIQSVASGGGPDDAGSVVVKTETSKPSPTHHPHHSRSVSLQSSTTDVVFQDFADWSLDIVTGKRTITRDTPLADDNVDGSPTPMVVAIGGGGGGGGRGFSGTSTSSPQQPYSNLNSREFVPVTQFVNDDGSHDLVFPAPDDEALETILALTSSTDNNNDNTGGNANSEPGGGSGDDRMYLLAVVGAFVDGVAGIVDPPSVHSQFSELFPELAQSSGTDMNDLQQQQQQQAKGAAGTKTARQQMMLGRSSSAASPSKEAGASSRAWMAADGGENSQQLQQQQQRGRLHAGMIWVSGDVKVIRGEKNAIPPAAGGGVGGVGNNSDAASSTAAAAGSVHDDDDVATKTNNAVVGSAAAAAAAASGGEDSGEDNHVSQLQCNMDPFSFVYRGALWSMTSVTGLKLAADQEQQLVAHHQQQQQHIMAGNNMGLPPGHRRRGSSGRVVAAAGALPSAVAVGSGAGDTVTRSSNSGGGGGGGQHQQQHYYTPQPPDPSSLALLQQIESDSKLCMGCQSRLCSVLSLPCGHLVMCRACSLTAEQCPMCKHDLTSVMHIDAHFASSVHSCVN